MLYDVESVEKLIGRPMREDELRGILLGRKKLACQETTSSTFIRTENCPNGTFVPTPPTYFFVDA